MATKRMLIDAAHPEETRVAVVEGDRLTDYDVEVASRRQIKGNIYLAKVTRVEPSLQAAFVDYGGNRHGFLAFSEIHPDYYQIPVADREALLAEQVAAERAAEAGSGEHDGEDGVPVDSVGGMDEDIDVQRPRSSPRRYKIQEVIKRRQILLVQVAKEERGTKGAALTTYLSLAGRYCVLMPNTTRGGGISRKITSAVDRKRLKKILGELGVPEGMAVIVRTAGSERSKAEIRRDYEYLIRLWNSIRELTLTSMAPTLVYEEGSLIKRSLRDLYDRDTDEILVEGDGAYRIAKDFMKLFIPSHAKRVQLYEDDRMPLFHRYRVENELEAMHLPMVHLKSGGSIVLNPTEALVAVDVNSGRSTRERHIEETALRTNLEACDEIARQLRLRDLAGLIVVDFIDMENSRNQSQVERRLKEAMKADRARVQLGRISHFGLLELSRQRLRPSLFETSFEVCGFCNGTGVRRTTESTALAIFRRIEQEGVEGRAGSLHVTVPTTVAFYLLNNKRRALVDMEQRFRMTIAISGDETLVPPAFEIESSGEPAPEPETGAVALEDGAEAAEAETDSASEEREEGAKKTRRRRPRRRKRRDGESEVAAEASTDESEFGEADEEDAGEGEEESADGEQQDDAQLAKKRRRRGKRGGRRRIRQPADGQTPAATETAAAMSEERDTTAPAAADQDQEEQTLVPTSLEPPSASDDLPEGQSETLAASAAIAADEVEHETDEVVAHVSGVDEDGAADERAEKESPAAPADTAETWDTAAIAESAGPAGVVEDAAAAAEDEAPVGARREAASAGEAESEEDVAAEGLAAEGLAAAVQEPAHVDEESPEVVAESEAEDELQQEDAVEEHDGAETEPASLRAAEMNATASRSVIINVGESDSEAGEGSPRRGWWQRLLNSNS